MSFAFSSSGGFQGASEIVPFASPSSLAAQTIISLNSSEIYFLNTTSEANSFLSSYHISLNAKSFFSARGIGERLGKKREFRFSSETLSHYASPCFSSAGFN